VNICIKIDEKSKIISLNCKVPLNTSINELIEHSVNKFNENFEKNSCPFFISSDYSSYTMVPSRKNGEPKTDLPGKKFNFKYVLIGFAPEATLSGCNLRELSLLYKIKSDSLDDCVMLRQRKKKIKCFSCVII